MGVSRVADIYTVMPGVEVTSRISQIWPTAGGALVGMGDSVVAVVLSYYLVFIWDEFCLQVYCIVLG
jgi:hypothetical protein